jgi:hypothetical protein
LEGRKWGSGVAAMGPKGAIDVTGRKMGRCPALKIQLGNRDGRKYLTGFNLRSGDVGPGVGR